MERRGKGGNLKIQGLGLPQEKGGEGSPESRLREWEGQRGARERKRGGDGDAEGISQALEMAPEGSQCEYVR